MNVSHVQVMLITATEVPMGKFHLTLINPNLAAAAAAASASASAAAHASSLLLLCSAH